MDSITYKAIRKRFFPEDPAGFLLEMGYGDPSSKASISTIRTRARRFENGKLPIPRNVARFAFLLDQWRLQGLSVGGELDDLPTWPEDI